MLDFNHRPKLSEEISALIDKALTIQNEQQTPRDYLGASRLGVSCNRALQFEYSETPKDEGQNFSGKILTFIFWGFAIFKLQSSVTADSKARCSKIGRASCRERV